MKWLEAACEAAPLTLSTSIPLQLFPPALVCTCPELKQSWQEHQALQPKLLPREEGSVQCEWC